MKNNIIIILTVIVIILLLVTSHEKKDSVGAKSTCEELDRTVNSKYYKNIPAENCICECSNANYKQKIVKCWRIDNDIICKDSNQNYNQIEN